MFLHTYHPSPILLTLGPVSIHWYGLCMVAGILAGYLLARASFRKAGLAVEFLERLLAPLLAGGFIGARVYHVLNELPYYAAHPLEIVAVWKGGLAIHGALIGGAAALFWFIVRTDAIAKRAPGFRGSLAPFLLFADMLAPGLALGQAIGRWGNYFNQELYGAPTLLPWGIPIDLASRVPGYEGYLYFHPAFLYESLWLFGVALILFFLLTRWARQEPFIEGCVFFLFLALAGIGRFGVEFLRIDAMPYLFGVRLQQLVSALSVALGIFGMLWVRRQRNLPSAATGTQ